MTVLTADWDAIPLGICLVRMFHERVGKHVFHLHLKAHDGPWYDQPNVPAYSQGIEGNEKFWEWAVDNLPIFDYTPPIPAA